MKKTQGTFPPDKNGSIFRLTHRGRRFERLLKQRARAARKKR